MTVTSVVIAFGLTIAVPAVAARASASVAHPVEFWRAIRSAGFTPPPGTDVDALALEASDLLASPDPELRDEIGFSALAWWIYQRPTLRPATVQTLVEQWIANLQAGTGERDTDSVFRRSFSALALSVVIARDNTAPALPPATIRRITDAALEYLASEQDVRGYDPVKGWMHSAAHTADLLKFLGRSQRLPPGGQQRILDGIATKLAASPVVFFNGEDERLARAVLSLINRPDFEGDAFGAWVAKTKPAPMKERPAVAELRAAQNVKNLYAKLAVLLATNADSGGRINAATAALRAALKDMF